MEQEKLQLPNVANVTEASMLPKAAWMVMFGNMRVMYKGALLTSNIVRSTKGKLLRAIEVGDYLYIEQEKFEQTHWAEMARKGNKILWIVHKPTAKLVGKVVNSVVQKL